jgi:hypothetical protein
VTDPHRGEGEAGEHEPADQDRPRAPPVDRDTGRHLGHTARQGEAREDRTQHGVARPELRMPHDDQRREDQLVEVRQPVAEADQAENAAVTPDREGCDIHDQSCR